MTERESYELEELKKRLQSDGDILPFHQAKKMRNRIKLLEKKDKPKPIIEQSKLF